MILIGVFLSTLLAPMSSKRVLTLLLCGYLRDGNISMIDDILSFIITWFNFMDKLNQRWLPSTDNSTETIQRSGGYAVGSTIFELFENSNLIHEWTFMLKKKRRTKPKHICFGIGIVKVTHPKKIWASMAERIGFECTPIEEYIGSKGHCIDHQDLLEIANENKSYTTSQVCFMEQDIIKFSVNCKEKTINLKVKGKLDGYTNYTINVTKNVYEFEYGKYRLFVWFNQTKHRTNMIDSFVVGNCELIDTFL